MYCILYHSLRSYAEFYALKILALLKNIRAFMSCDKTIIFYIYFYLYFCDVK